MIRTSPNGDNGRVELHQLEYFVAVADGLGFTRGGRPAQVVQSAVSAAITRLERELNAPLLDRTRRRVALTNAGSALLPEARATLAAAQSARDAVAAVRGGPGQDAVDRPARHGRRARPVLRGSPGRGRAGPAGRRRHRRPRTGPAR